VKQFEREIRPLISCRKDIKDIRERKRPSPGADPFSGGGVVPNPKHSATFPGGTGSPFSENTCA
jgi:hypothetical protein